MALRALRSFCGVLTYFRFDLRGARFWCRSLCVCTKRWAAKAAACCFTVLPFVAKREVISLMGVLTMALRWEMLCCTACHTDIAHFSPMMPHAVAEQRQMLKQRCFATETAGFTAWSNKRMMLASKMLHDLMFLDDQSLQDDRSS